MELGRVVWRTPEGDFVLGLDDEDRSVLRNVAPQLRAMLDDDLDDPLLKRLFPTAYHDDAERDREYQQLVRDDLADRRRAAVDILIATVDKARLDEAELLAWMGAINDLRLVLGTRLDVSEDTDPLPGRNDPDGPFLVLYGWLGYLLESILTALTGID